MTSTIRRMQEQATQARMSREAVIKWGGAFWLSMFAREVATLKELAQEALEERRIATWSEMVEIMCGECDVLLNVVPAREKKLWNTARCDTCAAQDGYGELRSN